MDPELMERMISLQRGTQASLEDRWREYVRTASEASLDYLSRSMGHTSKDKQEEKMTTAFELNLNNNSLSFGTFANGQVVDLNAAINLTSQAGSSPFSGVVTGNFMGEIKGAKTIPMTIPHKVQSPGGYNIIVIGAGGTGGYLIRDLARFIYAVKEKGDSRPFTIKLVDADVVEQKNILRQNFTPRDLGKPKAEVQARRYSSSFGLEIQAINRMIESPEDISSLLDHSRHGDRNVQNIIIGCVDNNKARRHVAETMRLWNGTYWIDSGNESKSGQVVCGYGQYNRYGYSNISRNEQFWLPNVTNLFPEILDPAEDDVEQADVSCADRSLVDRQNISVNQTAAGHILNYVRQIIMEEPITINKIEFNTKGVTEVEYITDSYMKKMKEAS